MGNKVSGKLCIRAPWPSMARTIYGDHDKFVETYYKYPGNNLVTLLCFTVRTGYYLSGDGAYRDEHGHYQITGRIDDVINTKGHRLGTAEVESAMVP